MTAHCPLVWMVRELQTAATDRALTFHETALAEFRRTATPFGPLHNSRAGVAVLYRYDPRQVTLTDPAGNPYYRPTVHHTVVERLVDGGGDYAPLALGGTSAHQAQTGPKGADVFMPDGSIARAETGPDYALVRQADPAFEPANIRSDGRELDFARGAMKSLDAPNREQMEIARDYVWLNRIAYFFFVALFLTALALPLLDSTIDNSNEGIWSQISVVALPFQWLLHVLGPVGDTLSRFMSGAENVLRGVGDTILSFTPSYLYAHVKAALNHPFFSIALVLAYFVLRNRSDAYEDATRYHARVAWNIQNDKVKSGIQSKPNATSQLVRTIRSSRAARSVLGVGRAMSPAAYAIVFVFTPLLLAANRIGFNYLEGSGRVCVDSSASEWVASASARFATNDPCWASRWTVERGGVYRLTISIDPKSDDPWLDQLMLTDPYGFDAKGWVQTAGVALRRWPSAAWFHPIARIGARGDCRVAAGPDRRRRGSLPARPAMLDAPARLQRNRRTYVFLRGSPACEILCRRRPVAEHRFVARRRIGRRQGGLGSRQLLLRRQELQFGFPAQNLRVGIRCERHGRAIPFRQRRCACVLKRSQANFLRQQHRHSESND